MKDFSLVTGYWPFFEGEATTEIIGFTDRVNINTFFSKSTVSVLSVLVPALALWMILTAVRKYRE